MDTLLPVNSSEGENKQNKFKRKAKGQPSKKGRIVIRNLSYKAEEQDVVNFFEPFGTVTECTFLKYEDGRNKGVAFLQYDNMLSALKAIKDGNLKKLKGRPIAVDLAVSKQRFTASDIKKESSENEVTIKAEEGSQQELKTELDIKSEGFIPYDKIKKEAIDSDQESDCHENKRKISFDDDDVKEIKHEAMDYDDDDDDNDQEDNDQEDDDQEDDYDEEDDDEEDEDDDDDFDEDEEEDFNDNVANKGRIKSKENEKPEFVRNSVSKDVMEGRTLFCRNLSFDASEEKLEEILSQFGVVKYVLFCRDKFSNVFKGTAFVQFMDKEASDACLEAFNDPAYKNTFKVGVRSFHISPAVARNQITRPETKEKKDKQPKDKRNLYLAREGVVREGTQPAIGVSKSDLGFRVVREKIKRKMLANLNIFVSPTRLFICNLPLKLNDKELRNLIKKYSPKNSMIKECRIMRNLFELDDNGCPVSKGHGFITFTEHNHALEALRNINNNPDMFTPEKRPIVEFSMENKAALEAKERRMQKSRACNIKKNEEIVNGENKNNNTDKNGNTNNRKKNKNKNKNRNKINNNDSNSNNNNNIIRNHNVPNKEPTTDANSSRNETVFMGANYDPKKRGLKALHSHIGPKIRHRDRGNDKSFKITRNKVNNDTRTSRGVKRKRNGNPKTTNKSKKPAQSRKLSKKTAHSGKSTKKFSNSKSGKNTSQKKPKSKKKKFIT